MKSHKKVDKRILRTRQALREALIELVIEQGYDLITVQMITARANIARTTFYLHFQDIDDLLFNGFQDVYNELQDAVKPTQMNSTADWEHVAKHAAFYKAMLGEHGNAAFVSFIRNLLANVMQAHVLQPILETTEPRLNPELIAHYLAGAQLGLYVWWLETDMSTPMNEMAQAGQDLAVKGLLWGLGVANSAVAAP